MALPTDPLSAPVVHALDFSAWKRAVVRQCFPGQRVVFIADAAAVPTGGVLVTWGMKPIDAALAPGVRVLRLEDGFLRSVGLGADLIRPLSWVIDSRGMYYDATRPSDLEQLLVTSPFPPQALARAARLRQRLVTTGITKYNVGVCAWQPPGDGKKIILVPGQVESDASLAYGAPGIRTNIEMLQAVRRANPGAHLVYKPHPDVIAGLRAQGAGEDSALQWCDQQVVNVDMGTLLAAVDEVHVLTSLAGFEALLRGKAVTCYGQPFYAGWGLTDDIIPNPRRHRRLPLDALVAAALIDYPLYLSRSGQSLITPEQALDELLAWRAKAGTALPWWRHCLRVLLRLVVGVR